MQSVLGSDRIAAQSADAIGAKSTMHAEIEKMARGAYVR
jgi:hypothetical protein